MAPLIHVTTTAASAGHDLALVAGLLTRETGSRGIGTATVTNRLVDALFVYILRAWLAGQPAGSAGRLGALRDTDDPILHIALEVDYASDQALSKAFTRQYATTPGRYRRQHSGNRDDPNALP